MSPSTSSSTTFFEISQLQLDADSLLIDWGTGTPPITLVEPATNNYSYPPAVSRKFVVRSSPSLSQFLVPLLPNPFPFPTISPPHIDSSHLYTMFHTTDRHYPHLSASISNPFQKEFSKSLAKEITLTKKSYLSLSLFAVGALWPSNDGKTLYQYGGQFSDSPPVAPSASNVFAYDIEGKEWSVVETGGDQVGRTAEGSTTFVPGLGENGENVGFCKSR